MLKFKMGLACLSIIFLTYVWFIEPRWIEVTYHQVNGEIEGELKIVQISDLHTKGFGAIEKKVLNLLYEIKPDVIVLTGDVSSPGSTRSDYYDVLSRFKAPKGVYFVHGNWEYWAPSEGFSELLSKAEIINLDNANIQLDKNVWLLGFEDALEGKPDKGLAFKNVPSGAYKIGIFHSPIYFDAVFNNVDIALSGHTHGGQVRLPFLPPFWLPQGSSRYASGWFSRGRGKMYVSRGVGTSILPFRLFCRPEIAVFNLSKK